MREKDDKYNVDAAKISQGQQELQLKSQQQQFKQMMEMQKAQMEEIKTIANALKSLRDATGADAIINPNTIEAYDGLSEQLSDE
jgi:ABC-type transport system involved in cytochrome bd biosynthesis fused ATPase/permease subunit